MEISNVRKSMIAAILGNVIFGFSFLASKIALGEATPLVLLSSRFLLATFILLLLAVTRIVPIHLKGKKIGRLIVLGILQPVVYFLCENYGVKYTNSSIAGIIISIIPVAAFFTGSILLKEKFHVKQLMWAIVSVLGVCVLSFNGGAGSALDMKGLLLLLGAVLAAALFNSLSRECADEFSAMERTFVMFLIGSLAFSVMALLETKGKLGAIIISKITTPAFIGPVIYLAVISSVLAFFLMNYSVNYLPVRQATSFASITSVISVVAGAVILHEAITYVQLVGIGLILVGVFMVNRQEV